ncbi:helix-turn-helix transcriptional regulator [Clostridium sp. DJ247]|uniref:helix-turn-helix domain-containing protein n=1 Tax=Clostridium sp. DJ247 TaxID=2726188 RepID=UPI0016268109|nr:helix-turn-helix transcriptional regulator [Clostridium sp. DJ247]MBC2579959.1 helix-turn-helix domain-containing protein [Clostridium sp. DJ247]
MLRIYVSDLLGKYKKTQMWLSQQTLIRQSTISMYYKETIKRMNTEDLEAIYKAFKQLDKNIKFNDIIDYVDNEEKAEE